ncbi:phosphonate ABC transporter, permease protein PhnE [bacterium]|nr:phosphonate ABC transporter, permease protein PhnE [bacterium]
MTNPKPSQASIIPPQRPPTGGERVMAIVKWLALLLLLAYLVAAFAGTGFNLYPIFEALQPRTVVDEASGETRREPPRVAEVFSKILQPDLSWHEREKDGSIALNPLDNTPRPGTLRLLLAAMNQTVQMALLGTLLSVLLSFPLAFLAAGNVMRGSALGRLMFSLTRGLLNLLRAFPEYILAILLVMLAGPGPLAGVLALAIHGVGSLGKLFAEAIEQADPAPVEAVRATGAHELLVLRHGLLPQVVPQLLAFSLYRWDGNIRMSVILGIVGAGGIGFLMTQYISLFKYRQASTAFLIILIAVSVLDYASGWLRKKIG